MRAPRRLANRAWVALVLCVGVASCTRAERANTTADTAAAMLPDSAGPDTIAARPPGLPVADGAPDSARANTDDATHAEVVDTARGIVRRVGSEPITRMVLTPELGETMVLVGRDSTLSRELQAAEGLEIVVTGERSSERLMDVSPGGTRIFRVSKFSVRAVDGVEARDGILRNIDGTWHLETSPSVFQPIVGLPTALRSQAGARIFLVGTPARAPQAFGVLRAR